MLMRAVVLVEVDAVREIVLLTVERTVFRAREVAVVGAQIAVAFGLQTIGAVIEAMILAVRQRAVAYALIDAGVLVMDAVLDLTGAGGERCVENPNERGELERCWCRSGRSG